MYYRTDLIHGEANRFFYINLLSFPRFFLYFIFDGVTMKDVSSLVSELFTIILIVSRSGYRTNWPLGLGELLHDPQSLSEMEDLR